MTESCFYKVKNKKEFLPVALFIAETRKNLFGKKIKTGHALSSYKDDYGQKWKLVPSI